MLTLFRWLMGMTIGLIVIATLGVGFAWYFAIRSLPDYNAEYEVGGISAPVEIVRSTENVPHIFATSDDDAFFALGLAHAQDRLFQMVVMRRAAQGRLSEIYGQRGLLADDLARRLGFYRSARASLAVQDDPTKAALTAYAAGINEWIGLVNKKALGRGAPEFFLFPDEISYWTPADSLAILKLLAAGSSRQVAAEVMRARLHLTVPDRGQDLVAALGEPSLPSWQEMFPGTRTLPADRRLAARPDWGTQIAGYIAPGLGASGNAFAAAGSRTAEGSPLLANDPHFALTAPSLWYLARIGLQSGDVIGGTIPGIPAILSGRSAKMAWGIVPANLDDTDIFIEEVNPGNPRQYRDLNGWADFTARQEVIHIRDSQDVTITLRDTPNGSVVPGVHFGLSAVTPIGHVAAIRWVGTSQKDTTMSALRGLMTSQSRPEAARAVESMIAPSLSISLADQQGVTQVLAGHIPDRNAAQQGGGRVPSAGWIAGNRWSGTTRINHRPPSTEVISATGSIPTSLAGSLGYDGQSPMRQDRLDRLLGSRQVHSRDSFIDNQLDIVSPAARSLLPLVGADLWFTDEPAAEGSPERQRQDALGLLAEWDGAMSEHLPEPLIYAAWMAALQQRLIRDDLGALAEDITQLSPSFIERVFRNRGKAAEWCDIRQSAAIESCTMIARQSLDAAILDLTARFGPDVTSWRWGNLHESMQLHPGLGGIRGLGWITNLRQSLSGGDFTLAAAGLMGEPPTPWRAVTGAGYRAVYDLADPDSSVFTISTGQSGHPLSRHYDDLAGLWRRGEYIGMSLDPALARAAAVGITTLYPSQDQSADKN